jgi:hypothetical protein
VNTLPEKARADLRKILGLLESTHEGERDAAVGAATRLLERYGLRWCEVLSAVSVTLIPSQDRPRGDHDPSDGDPFGGRDWRDIAARCRQFRHLIDNWEERFLADVFRDGGFRGDAGIGADRQDTRAIVTHARTGETHDR